MDIQSVAVRPIIPLSHSRRASERKVRGSLKVHSPVRAGNGMVKSGSLIWKARTVWRREHVQRVGVEQEGERWVVDLVTDGDQEDSIDSVSEETKSESPNWEENLIVEKMREWRRIRWVKR